MNFFPAKLYQGYRNLIRNPHTRLWVILGTIVYLLSPLDLAPDILPFAGQLDDVVLVTILASELFQLLLTGNRDQTSWTSPDSQETAQTTAQDTAQTTAQTRQQGGDRPKVVDVKAVSVDDE